MVCSPNGLKYVKPAWALLGEAVDGRFRAGIPLGRDFVGHIGGRFGVTGSLATDDVVAAAAAAAAVVRAVGGSVGRRR